MTNNPTFYPSKAFKLIMTSVYPLLLNKFVHDDLTNNQTLYLSKAPKLIMTSVCLSCHISSLPNVHSFDLMFSLLKVDIYITLKYYVPRNVSMWTLQPRN